MYYSILIGIVINSSKLQVAPIIKDQMVKTGTMMVTYMPLGDKPNFFRMVTISPLATEKDMDFVLDEIDRLGYDLIV